MNRYELSCEVNGRVYKAHRVVIGTRKLRQHIEFMGHVEHDAKTYATAEAGEMDAVARLILWRLITRGWLGHPPVDSRASPAD
jgi:hypothetical protein